MSRKWFVANLSVPSGRLLKEDLLVAVFGDVISEFRTRVKSWHFLWESAPYPHTLLLRFYGKSHDIDELKGRLVKYLESEGIEYTPDSVYAGEEGSYGVKGWRYVMESLHLGADSAIDLIRNDRSRDERNFPKPLEVYIDRWVHLFLNQLGTRVAEHKILFILHAHRYIVNLVGEQRYRQIAGPLNQRMPNLLNQSKQRLDDFANRMAQERGWV